MARLTRIYTRGGDEGETSLADGSRVAKDDLRIEICGAIDECSATIGIARLHVDPRLHALLTHLQDDLFTLGADLADPRDRALSLRLTQTQVEWLEERIDELNDVLKPLDRFILPGGSPGAAYLHLARTVARRAERHCVRRMRAAGGLNPVILRYLNRLSDFLFVAARSANHQGDGDILWFPRPSEEG